MSEEAEETKISSDPQPEVELWTGERCEMCGELYCNYACPTREIFEPRLPKL